MARCFGVKIILQDSISPVTEYTSYGLYNVASSNSEFRWIQTSLTGLSGWKSGMIIEGGLKPFSVEIDLRLGGDTSRPGKGSVVITNYMKFQEFLSGRGIDLTGLKLEIWYFDYHDSIELSRRIRTYVCEEPSFSSSEYTIPFKGTQEKRIANILNTVTSVQFPYASQDTIGKIIPASFGKLIPKINQDNGVVERGSLAKFVRVNDRVESKYYSDTFFTGSTYINTVAFPITDLFPASDLYYKCDFRGTGSGTGTLDPTNTYVKVVDGTGNGQMRKVDAFSWSTTQLTFHIVDFFNTELSDSDESEGGRSWVQFIKVNRLFYCDHWSCIGFYDTNGNDVQYTPELYTYDSADGIQRIAPYGYRVDELNESKNKMAIDPKLFDNGDLDLQNSFLILSAANFELCTDATLENWGISADVAILESGIFVDNIPAGGTHTYNNLNYATDKDSTTYFSSMYDTAFVDVSNPILYKAFVFDFPELPAGFSFTKLYIGIKMTETESGSSGTQPVTTNIKVMIRKFKFTYSNLSTNIDSLNLDPPDLNTIDTLPDFYYTDNPPTGNEHFFVVNTTGTHDRTGYTLIDTGITSKDQYESYIQGALLFEFIWGGTVSSNIVTTSNIYEIAFMFEKSNDIADAIYGGLYGRKSGSIDPSRIGENILLESPPNVFEHVCRLQDYRDTCNIPVSGWGLQYASNALICTTSFGSFDDASLTTYRDYDITAQIVDYSDGFTDKLKQSLCHDLVLANWQDGDGYEKIIPLPAVKLNPVYTITLDDVLDRGSIKVTTLPQDKIYAEPFVNYNKNAATGKYDNQMSIKNTSASVYNPAYISGFNSEIDGQVLWNACHSLALQCHQVNKPSTELTDLKWANGRGGYTIALGYLQNWVRWQLNDEVEFRTHYNIAASWQECTPINILFSHQTNNVSRSALVEQCTHNPNHPYDVMIKAIMYA